MNMTHGSTGSLIPLLIPATFVMYTNGRDDRWEV